MARLIELFDIQRIEKGKPFLDNPAQWRIKLALCKRKMERKNAKRFAIGLWEHEVDNSRPQQKFYRKVLCEWVGQQEAFQCSGAVMHGIYQKEGFWDDVTPSGETYIKSTALGEWTQAEFSQRCTTIMHWLLHEREILTPTQEEVAF
jgi:hypothetical protein